MAGARGWRLADGEASIGVDFGDGVGPESVTSRARGGQEGISSLTVVGKVGLVSESPLKESVCGGGLLRASDLTTPEAAKLRGLDGVAWHWNFE